MSLEALSTILNVLGNLGALTRLALGCHLRGHTWPVTTLPQHLQGPLNALVAMSFMDFCQNCFLLQQATATDKQCQPYLGTGPDSTRCHFYQPSHPIGRARPRQAERAVCADCGLGAASSARTAEFSQ